MSRLVGLLTTVVLSATLACGASATAAAPVKSNRPTGQWENFQGEFAGRQTCMAMGSADRSTVLTLKLDTGHMADHVVALLFTNMDWSIKEDDQLGELRFHAGDQIAGAEPVAAERGFFFYMSLETAQVWFDKTRASGFWIERDGKEIARFKGGNLAEAFRKIRACGERLVKADPFSQPAASAPSPSAGGLPEIAEPAATPPKPLNLWPWIEAVKDDYLKGPSGGTDLQLRQQRRNSSPASVRYKMAVDEKGKTTGCEVLASGGLWDWQNEFCQLALRHRLQFAPALSASGKSVRGEYVGSAAMAFE